MARSSLSAGPPYQAPSHSNRAHQRLPHPLHISSTMPIGDVSSSWDDSLMLEPSSASSKPNLHISRPLSAAPLSRHGSNPSIRLREQAALRTHTSSPAVSMRTHASSPTPSTLTRTSSSTSLHSYSSGPLRSPSASSFASGLASDTLESLDKDELIAELRATRRKLNDVQVTMSTYVSFTFTTLPFLMDYQRRARRLS